MKETQHYQLQFFGQKPLALSAYFDADWGCCFDSKKFIIGYCVFFFEWLFGLLENKKAGYCGKIHNRGWIQRCRHQVAELLWIFHVLQEFDIDCSGSIVLMCDNKSTLHMLKNPTYYEKTKHIDINCHFVRHHVASGFLNLVFMPISLQLPRCFYMWRIEGSYNLFS